MRINKAELKGYKRIALNNIQYIRMEPKHVIQLILGTNGAGKTSLLRELTPLPSNPSAYEKDGYKLLDISHRGHEYQVVNEFDGKSGKYQLIKNGTNIFQGSTATDFRALIKQEFGITPEIQTLIDGVARFSSMDVSKRRHWLTLLSHADYTYAFQYYNRLKSRIRDLQGSLNITRNRHVSEVSRMLSEQEVERIHERRREYQNVIQYLLENKPRNVPLKSELESLLRNQDEMLQFHTSRVNQLRGMIAKIALNATDSKDISIEVCQTEVYKLQGGIELLKGQHDDVASKLEGVLQHSRQTGTESNSTVSELVQIQSSLRETRQRLWNSRTSQVQVSSGRDFQSGFEAVYDSLIRIFEDLPEDTREYNRHSREIQVGIVRSRQVEHGALKQSIAQAQSTISAMDYAKANHKRVCPKCDHQWFHGYDEKQYIELKRFVEINVVREELMTNEILTTQQWISEADRIFDLRHRYIQLVRSWPRLSPLWDLFHQEEIETFNPKKAKNVVEAVLIDIPILLRLDQIDDDLKHNDELIQIKQQQSEADVQAQQDYANRLENELHIVQEQIRDYEQRLRINQRLIQLFTECTDVLTNLEGTLEAKEKNRDFLKDSLRVDHVNRLVMIFRQEVSNLEQQISRIDIQKSQVEQYAKQIADHEEQIRLLKMAEQAMSPSSGLIAKGLTGFINWFISKMNQFVKHIWVYPLEILPITIDDDADLDYKFPVVLDQKYTHKTKDISETECNKSTCDVFDLAFRFVAMECLGLKEFPLQVDEFGSSFDAKHRSVAFQVVTSLATTTDISQIFMVSHAEQSYGSLKNCDITVLHADNIILPEGVVINGQTTIR